MSKYGKLINEARQALSEGPMQSAMTKMAKAKGEKSMNMREKRFVTNNKGARNNAANTFNKAQRRMGKAMATNPEESK